MSALRKEDVVALVLTLVVLALLTFTCTPASTGWRYESGSSQPSGIDRGPAPDSAQPRRTEIAAGGARVRGRVLDSDGAPREGALVGDVTSAVPVRTGAGGGFELALDRAPDRLVTLLVRTSDHAPLLHVHGSPGPPADLDVGDLRLLRGGGLRGRVVDGAGAPVRSALVTLVPASGHPLQGLDVDEVLPPVPVASDATWTAAHLAPGRYRVVAGAPGMQGRQAARTYEVRDGAVGEVEPLVLAPGHRLRGRVLGPDDTPLSGARVRVRNGPDQPRYDVRLVSDAGGRFVADAAPPRMRVRVERDGFLRHEQEDVAAATELVVHLAAGLRISGAVRDARTGRPVERFAVAVRRVGRAAPTRLGSAEQQLRRQAASLREAAASSADAAERGARLRLASELDARLARVIEDGRSRPAVAPADRGRLEEHATGRFAVEGLQEGMYVVGITSPNHRYTESAPVAVQRGAAAPDLRIELAAGSTVAGVVVAMPGGRPFAGARVELRRVVEVSQESEDRRRSLFPWVFARPGPRGVAVMTTTSGADGAFEFTNAAPGRCFLAVRHPSLADHDAPEFVVGPGLRAARVEVPLLATLAGRVHGASAAADSTVVVLGGHGVLRQVRVGPDGGYRVAGLQPGSYLVRAFPAADRRYVDRLVGGLFPLHAGALDEREVPPRDVELRAGETRTFDLSLDVLQAGTVRGTVTINGLPGAGARAVLRPVAGGLSHRAGCDPAGQFTLESVPAGAYRVRIYGASGQELHDEALIVVAGDTAAVRADLAAGGLAGRVLVPDGGAADVRGTVWVLPGAEAAPADVYAYRRTARAHRLRVRNAEFRDAALTPGPAILIVDVPGRRPATSAVVVPKGRTLTLDLRAGPAR